MTAISPASDESARAVAIAWRRVLGEAPVPGESFLEAAGDSLQLLTFVFALESRVGRRLPLEAFGADADAAEMAVALDTVLAGDPMPGDDVFLFPGARGDTPGLAALRADCVGVVSMTLMTYPDWRAIVADPSGPTGMTLAGMIAATLAQIRQSAPEGPVTLVGYSWGVRLAHAAAAALEAEGRTVRRLVVIDLATPQWHRGGTHVWTPPRTPREAWWELSRMRRPGGTERVGMMLARSVSGRWLRPVVRRAMRGPWPARLGQSLGDAGYWAGHHLAQELRLLAVWAWTRTLADTPPARLKAAVSLIRTTAHPPDAPEDLGWRAVSDEVTVVQVGGDHVSMLSSAHRAAVSAAVMAAVA